MSFAQYKLWTMWDEPSAANLKLHYRGSAGNELCPTSISLKQVPQSARKHTDHNLEPYSANDVQSSLSPACPLRGALLCKPLCVSNKTQGGPTQVNLRSAHLCFTPPRPDYHLFSSAPLWSDTFGRGGARGAEEELRQMKFLLHIHRLSSKLGVHLILTEHFKQTEVKWSNDSRPKFYQSLPQLCSKLIQVFGEQNQH